MLGGAIDEEENRNSSNLVGKRSFGSFRRNVFGQEADFAKRHFYD